MMTTKEMELKFITETGGRAQPWFSRHGWPLNADASKTRCCSRLAWLPSIAHDRRDTGDRGQP